VQLGEGDGGDLRDARQGRRVYQVEVDVGTGIELLTARLSEDDRVTVD